MVGRLALEFGEDLGGSVEVKATSPLPTGEWVHIAATRGGSTASLYVNGELEASAAYGFTPINKGHTLRTGSIGTTDGWVGFFKGKIDDVRIYDEALSGEETAQLSQDGM